MTSNNYDEPIVQNMTRIAKDLERVIVAIYMCAGLLAFIAFILVLRTLIGR